MTKCFELDYQCPFPDRRDPGWCKTCTEVLINMYTIKNYALMTLKSVRDTLEEIHLRKEEKKLNPKPGVGLNIYD